MHESEEILTEVLLAGVRGFPAEIGRAEVILLQLLRRCSIIGLISRAYC